MTAHAKTLDETATVTESFFKTIVRTIWEHVAFNYRAAVDMLLDYTADALPYIAQYLATSITHAPETLDGGATTVPLGDEEKSGDITLPFTFTYFGRAYTTLRIVSNGWVEFKDPVWGTYLTSVDNTWLYDNDFNNYYKGLGFIAGVMKDLDPSAETGAGTVKYQTFGTTPNRIFVIEFNGVPEFDFTGTSEVTFQIHIKEADNSVEIHSTTVTNEDTNGFIQWIQGWDGAGIEYGTRGHSYGTTLTNDAVRFALNGSYAATAWGKSDTYVDNPPTTEEIVSGKLHILTEGTAATLYQGVRYWKRGFAEGKPIVGVFVNMKIDSQVWYGWWDASFIVGDYQVEFWSGRDGDRVAVGMSDGVSIYDILTENYICDYIGSEFGDYVWISAADYHTIGVVVDTENNVAFLVIDGLVRGSVMLGNYVETHGSYSTPLEDLSSLFTLDVGAEYDTESFIDSEMEVSIDSIQLKSSDNPATMLGTEAGVFLSETATLGIEQAGVLHRNLSGDTLTLTEFLTTTFGKFFVEVVTLTETFGHVARKILSETLTLTEVFIKKWARVLSETLGLTEAFTKAKVIPPKILAETITLTEAFVKKWVRVLTENLTLTVSFLHAGRKIFLEAITLTETIGYKVRKILAEIATLTETFVKQRRSFKVLTETLTLTAAILKKFKLIALETLTLTDSILRRLNGMIVRWTKQAKDILGWTKQAKDTDDWTKQDKDF